MGIPIPSGLVTGATPYQATYSAIPVSVCKPDPIYQPKALSLQFEFADSPVWLVNLQQGLPSMSQVSSMYIDATASATNVIIIFPDTGYQVQVTAGKSLLCPVLTGKTLPSFYVVINSGGVTTSDIVNLILLNFFIPEFASP